MDKRITVNLEPEIEAKLRKIRSQFIEIDSSNWSFAKIVNMVLLTGLVSCDQLDMKSWAVIKKYIQHDKMELTSVNTNEFVSVIKSSMDQWV